jgi:ketosteroid isomerase-like protein
MAARRKTARRGAKKTARKPARKKAPRKKGGAARKKARARKPARKKGTGGGGGRGRAAARSSSGSSIDAIARKIVKYGVDPRGLKLSDLYTDDCTSQEAGPGEPVVGLAALQRKIEQWEEMVDEATFKPRNVLAAGKHVMIEWDGEVRFKNGRSAKLAEVAVHEIRGGKIAAERYYYDPAPIGSAIAGQPSAAEPSQPQPEPPRYTPSPGTASTPGTESGSPVDPLDL